MQRRRVAVMLCVIAGCENKPRPPPKPPAPTVRLAFGGCAPTTVTFDAGPRPNPPPAPPPPAPSPPPQALAPPPRPSRRVDEGHMVSKGHAAAQIAELGMIGLLADRMPADAPSGVDYDAWTIIWGGLGNVGSGGLGLSGVGGTGIGIGRLGVIAHGHGYGVAHGRPHRTAPAVEPATAPKPAEAAPPPLPVPAPAAPDFAAYRPPQASPLAAAPVDGELRACLDKAPPGVAILDLTYAADDTVTSAVERGGLSGSLARCVETAARHARRTPIGSAKPASERCAIAFGTTPVDAAPGLDLTRDMLLLDHQRIATPAELTGDAPIPKLNDQLTVARGAAPLAVRGPLIVRVVESAPFAAVRRVISALLTARRDFVLATLDGGQWRLLSPVELPVVPVPAGITGNWGVTSHDAKAPTVTVLVRHDTVWIALPTGEPVEVPHERVAPTIEMYTKAPAAAPHTQLEISATDDATYGQLAAAISAAGRAGLPAWKLVPLDNLRRHP